MKKNIFKLEDKRLSQMYEGCKKTGLWEPFIEECCLWLVKCSARAGADEDTCSEIVLKFLERPLRIIELFEKGQYPNFPAFLSAVARHLTLNERKLKNLGPPEHYLMLWRENTIVYSDEEEQETLFNSILERMKGLDTEARLILKLRNNIYLDQGDYRELEVICEKNRVAFHGFIQKDLEKRQRKNAVKRKLIARMNHYNKKIIIHGDFSYQKNKRQLFERIDRLNYLYSFSELGVLFGMTSRKVASVYRKILYELGKCSSYEKRNQSKESICF